MKNQITLLSAILFFLTSLALQSQLALYPTAAFIDPMTRTGSMQVINTSKDMREIDISFKFGYFAYDSLGNSSTRYDDSVREKEYSLIPYIKVFPKKLLIPPNQQATIRFMVSNIPEGKDQFYWTRIVAGSVPEIPQIDTLTKGKINAQIIIKSEMVGLVAFLKGKNTSSLDFEIAKAYTDTSKFIILLKQEKTGNSPFWGFMSTEIYDSEDNLVDKTEAGLAIYFSCVQKIVFDRSKFKPGKYTAKITVTNERKEVPKKYQSKFGSKTKVLDFVVE